MLVVNGINIVQTFFVIGGFLTSFIFLVHVEKEKSSSWFLLFKAALLRYIRFIPLLLLTVLMHATWLYHIGRGPFWDRVNFTERQFCRENWWTNLLFLDNYVNAERKCLIHRFYFKSLPKLWKNFKKILFQLVLGSWFLAEFPRNLHADFDSKVKKLMGF